MKMIALFCLLLTACTYTGSDHRSLYEGARQSAEANCNRQPDDARQRCLQRVNRESYDDYQRQRRQD